MQTVYADGERKDKWNGQKIVDCWEEVQGRFRRMRRTEDNLFMLERLMEMVKVRKDRMFVDMEKA